MLRYSLRQLEYLLAVADAGTVAGAARRLGVAQPTVSASVAKLEDQIGVQLLIRHHAQGVSLTPAGAGIVREARQLVRQAKDLQAHAGAAGEAMEGDLGVGAFLSLAPAYMPALISEFQERHRRVRIALHEGTQDQIVDGLRSGRFELALAYAIGLPKDVHAEPLTSLEPHVLLSARHRLARRKRVTLAALKDEPFILFDVAPSRAYFTGLLRDHGIEPKIAFSSPSLELVRGLVGRGAGYSLLVTRPHGERTYEGKPLAVRPIAEPCRPSEVSLASLKQVRPTRLMTAFTEFAKTWFSTVHPSTRTSAGNAFCTGPSVAKSDRK
jgi:DNA-binding transcriptional LysR family regulator